MTWSSQTRRWYYLWLLAVMLGACASGVSPGNVDPTRLDYTVNGVRYRVLPSTQGYVARGIASWYGEPFHGRPTSNGEIYDMHQMTAAHRSLPIPSYVKVTSLANGRSVVVRVNDRGPFHQDRIIDLSFAAAEQLDLIQAGTGRVEVRALPRKAWPDTAPVREFFVQLGSFTLPDNAQRLRQRLLEANFGPVRVLPLTIPEGILYRVRIGPLASLEIAEQTAAKLRAQRLTTGAHVVLD